VGDRVQLSVRGRRCRRRHLLAVLTIAVVVSLGATVPALAEDGSVEPQVVGGTPVPDGKYPFMTSIQANTSKKPPYKEHFCGGTLIDQNSVLTAAHCVDFIGNRTDNDTLSFRDVRLVVGVTVLSSSQGKVRRIDRLSDISVHPDYNGRTSSRYDAAVIEVGRPVRVIAPIALAGVGSDELETPGRPATVTGWGNTIAQPPFGPGGPQDYPKRMREAQPPLVSDEDCELSYGRDFYPELMVCAGQTGMDTCQGDSGGPMFVEATSGTRRQIGITSFGYGCGATGFPGVYTEVNAKPVFDFIERAANR
jgi:secreted trypsin-like serine protease